MLVNTEVMDMIMLEGRIDSNSIQRENPQILKAYVMNETNLVFK